ncbi:MAG: c-type cytochrome [Pirellulales bacterium]|nr:c-type cytochrome [Pirellulales bacterium]
MAESQDVVRDHGYDGIQEYDNPLPGWWNFLFYGSIIFSALYMLYYHTGAPNRSRDDAYNKAVADNLRLQFAEIGELQPDEATLLKYMAEPRWLTVGELVFKGNCVSCHGPEGQGLVGPNLHDDSWIHVKTLTDIPKVITNGAKGGAMPAWKTRLHPNEVVLVACYVANMRSAPLTSGKPPEKEAKVIPAWPAVPPPSAAPAAAPEAPATNATGGTEAASQPPSGAS